MSRPTSPDPDVREPADAASTDAQLAAQIAQEAGRALLRMRADFGEAVGHHQRRELMDAGDRLAQQMLAERLAAHRPADAVLSEEAPDSSARLTADRVWIIDPLDGTSEFGAGRRDFAVHVALWRRDAAGRPTPPGIVGALTDAAVDVPIAGETWRTDEPAPAPPLPVDRPLRIVVSRSRRPPGLTQLLIQVSAGLASAGITDRGMVEANVGSVGAKVGEVMAGRAHAYLHPGGLNEWDLAAPLACALARGLVVLGPVHPFNRMPPTSGPVLIAHPAIADVLAAHWDR